MVETSRVKARARGRRRRFQASQNPLPAVCQNKSLASRSINAFACYVQKSPYKVVLVNTKAPRLKAKDRKHKVHIKKIENS